MNRIASDIYEIVIGAFVFGLGLLFLVFQSRSTYRLIKAVEYKILEQGDLYQQYSTVDINLISSHELYAIILGVREFPLVIDGNYIAVDGNDYGSYFSYVRSGYYKKAYIYDAGSKIKQIVFTYSGL